MTKNERSRVLIYLVCPYGLATISYAFFLCSCLVPPSIYSFYMREPDLMFLDSPTILLYSLCVASFVVGVWLIGRLLPPCGYARRLKTRMAPAVFLLVPLILGIAAAAVSLFLLIKQVPTLFLLILSQHGESLKEIMAFDVEGRFTFAPLLLTGITWWAYWRSSSLGLLGWTRRLTSFLIFLSVLILIAYSIVTVSRNILMPIVCGLGILYLMRRAEKKAISRRFVLGSGLTFVTGVFILFFCLSFLRGVSNWDEQIHSILGYTIASYNRLAAIVNGRISYPYSGNGLYLSSIATHTRLLPLRWIFNPPDALSVWSSEFVAISGASLDSNFIWPGAFGQIFSDLKWFSLPFVFGYGIMYGIVWRWFKCEKCAGVVLYPWFGFCILFWLGTNYLLDSPFEPLLAAALLLTIYEAAFLQEEQKSTEGLIAAAE